MSTATDKAVTPAALRQRRRRARLTAAREIEFVRADWALFLHPDRLPQKAGCPRDHLRAMILKEIVDNALDAGAGVTLDHVDADTWIVSDDGAGLDRDQVLRFFAVNRPMVSTKLIRRPTRGAIGNGLRVVTGGVLASGGKLTVESRGARYVLEVDRGSGETLVIEEGASEVTSGTRVTVAFGEALPSSNDDGRMARLAVHCAGPAAQPMRSHPSWYDDAAFAELVEAAPPGATVADIAAQMGVWLDNDRPAVEANIMALRVHAGAPPKLLPLGPDLFPGSYTKDHREAFEGALPAVAEAWVTAERCPPSRGHGTVTLLVNRSPIAADIWIKISTDGRLAIYGCRLAYHLDRVPSGGAYEVVLAVTSPVIPVTTEGKEPDLRSLWPVIHPALASAMRKAHRAGANDGRKKGDIKDTCYEVLPQAYMHASGNNEYGPLSRQVWYSTRPFVQQMLGAEAVLDYDWFQIVLVKFQIDNPELTRDWKVNYDARGHLTEPHTGRTTPVGTLQIDRLLNSEPGQAGDLVSIPGLLLPTLGPKYRFKNLVYIEKEGFEPQLKQAGIAEQFDCAIMSTKGMSVTAARLIVDRYAQQGVRIFVVHDFDRSGATIAHTLGHTNWRYEFEENPKVIDLGLSLADARRMGLQHEAASKKGASAEKLREYGRSDEEIDFLINQGRRYELNAMPVPQFLGWLVDKLEEHGAGKMVPENEVLERHGCRLIARRLAMKEVKALSAKWEARAAQEELPADLRARVERLLKRHPGLSWEEALDRALRR